jgi:hypothetical protein
MAIDCERAARRIARRRAAHRPGRTAGRRGHFFPHLSPPICGSAPPSGRARISAAFRRRTHSELARDRRRDRAPKNRGATVERNRAIVPLMDRKLPVRALERFQKLAHARPVFKRNCRRSSRRVRRRVTAVDCNLAGKVGSCPASSVDPQSRGDLQ